MLIVQIALTCCQLLFTPLCLSFKPMLVWVIFAPAVETDTPFAPARHLKNLWPVLQIPLLLHFSSDSQISGPAAITFLPVRWDTRRSSQCFSNAAFDLSFKGSFIYCRKLDVKWASAAAVCSSMGFLWGTGCLGVRSCGMTNWQLSRQVPGALLSFVWFTGV